jgi:hypothetical protein
LPARTGRATIQRSISFRGSNPEQSLREKPGQ